jgi:hypothetical protein
VDTLTLYYRVDASKIVLLKSLLEGYEGLAVVRTADPKKGIVQLLVGPDFLQDLEHILEDLRRHIWIESVPEDEVPEIQRTGFRGGTPGV